MFCRLNLDYCISCHRYLYNLFITSMPKIKNKLNIDRNYKLLNFPTPLVFEPKPNVPLKHLFKTVPLNK